MRQPSAPLVTDRLRRPLPERTVPLLLLFLVPGFYVTYDRVYDDLGERGFGRLGNCHSRFLLRVGGRRVNDNTFELP